jgi:2,3-dihydroxybenzoate decarboxylase
LIKSAVELARQVPAGMPMLGNLSSYWQTNLFETTSGNFATDLLNFHIDQIGLNRIMYSVYRLQFGFGWYLTVLQVDYPFVSMDDGQAWLEGLAATMKSKDLLALKRGLAVEVLRLNR